MAYGMSYAMRRGLENRIAKLGGVGARVIAYKANGKRFLGRVERATTDNTRICVRETFTKRLFAVNPNRIMPVK